ncbi:Immunity protein Imm1 [Actinopolyspora alba]|uniref:Immunity protein Imm1 n=1 Tax=Actinopolyspora alba TaxID=673379 RepID=A0A1I1WMZ7_9ACTN|nr:Imm1 family immunity protein [Actinopolyspora alba]SFD94783.1 Immunity protein Imm1 [Actinopolyspora alba]
MTTIDTTTVLTIMFDQYRRSHHAYTAEEIATLLDHVVTESTEGNRTTLVTVWDRPAHSHHDDGQPEYPPAYLRVAVDPDTGWGAMTWIDLTAGGVLDTFDPAGPDDRPALVFAADEPSYLPNSASLPLERIRRALCEYAETGTRPTTVRWQQGYLVL